MGSDDATYKKIEYDQVYSRLEESKIALEKGFSVSPAEKNKILKERARLLSGSTRHMKEDEDQVEVTEFTLAYENYVIESRYISEVCRLNEFTPIPCTPDFVLGIINVRGRIVSIIDLKNFFDLPDKGLGDFNKIIIINSDQNELGLVADDITGVRSFPVSELQSSLQTLSGIRERYLKGVLKDRSIFLDATKILSDKTITIHENVET